MIADEVRMGAYEAALRQAVFPGAIVLDIGCGTGIFSYLALSLGAAHVYAVDPSPAVQVGIEIAKKNGVHEAITFYQDISTNITLPEPVDVVISDLRGVLPLLGAHIPSLIDARQRLLKPDGTLIPQMDKLRLAVVHAPKLYEPVDQPWSSSPYGFDMSSATRYTASSWYPGRVERSQLLCPPATWSTLDYRTVESPDVHSQVEVEINKNGTAHGLIIWFNTNLFANVGFSNEPGIEVHPKVYGSAFFPWSNPVDVEPGDIVSIAINADLVYSKYHWLWHCTLRNHSGDIKSKFSQGSFFSSPVTRSDLQRRRPDYVPELDLKGQMELFSLNLVDGKMSSAEIAHKLLEQYPDSFRGSKDALTFVTKLLEKRTA